MEMQLLTAVAAVDFLLRCVCFSLSALSQILKPADKKLFYSGGGGMGSGRPVTPPRKAKK